MEDYKPSIVEYFSESRNSHCGYCSTSGSSIYGLYAHSLTVEDYQNMIDRGWRRCGHHCYKSIMKCTCCPLYTIRCAAKEFKLSKSHKKILKRFNNFLISGKVTKDKIHKSTEIVQHMEVNYLKEGSKVAKKEDLNIAHLSKEASIENKCVAQDNLQKEEKKHDTPVKPVKVEVSNMKEGTNKSKCMKAKYLRIERKKQKLRKLGLGEDEIAKKLVEKKKYPVTKTIEDYVSELSSKNKLHNLKISLVRSFPRSEEFENTFAVTFALYKQYQMFIHNSKLEKLTQPQFERFLVISPLQIYLTHVKSSEFEKTLKESASLFAKYQKAIHHERDGDCDVSEFISFLVDTPLEASNGYGSFHQQYWLDDKLIAVGVIDILPKCVSSVYFFYDPDYAYLSLGTYGALREIEFTRKLSTLFPELEYYYMGLYIHSCVKMRYKAAFKPSFLLCPEVYTWHPIQECLPKLDISKYSRFNEDLSATDINSNISHSEVLVLHKRRVITFANYLKQKQRDSEEVEEVEEYAKLVGKICAKNMLLFRK